MTTEQLKAILDAHKLWLNGDKNGERANLRGSDLRYSNLSYSDLRGSDLSGSDLRGSDLRYSNLSGSDLRGSDLRGAAGMFDAADWIAKNLKRTRGGVIAYKTFGSQYPAPGSWVIEPGSEIAENVNPLPTLDCACGVNVATLEWCQKHGGGAPIWRLLVKWEWLAAGVIPWGTGGKFRVPRAKLIEVVTP